MTTAQTGLGLGRLTQLYLDEGQQWGSVVSPQQIADARAVLDIAEDAPRMHMFIRPRGGGKTTDAAGIAIAALLEQLPSNARCYAAAGDAAQAGLLLDGMRKMIALTPGLKDILQVTASRVSHRHTHATLDVLAADAPGAYGKLADLVMVDELCWWPDTPGAQAFWQALVSGMAKRPGVGRRPRLVVISAPSSPDHWSYKVFQRAEKSSRWNLSRMPGPLPWVDPADLAEQEALLLPSVFRQLHLAEWADPEDRLSTKEAVEACCILPGPLGPQMRTSYVISLDVGIVNDRTVVTVAHLERDETVHRGLDEIQGGTRVVFDQILVWHGSHKQPVDLVDVRQTIVALHRTYARAHVVIDPAQFEGPYQELIRAGVPVEKFTFTPASNNRLATTLFRLLRERRLALPAGDAELIDELTHVRLVQTGPGMTRMDHTGARHDDRAVAIALAAQSLLAGPPSDIARYAARQQAMYPGTHTWRLAGRAGPEAQELARIDEMYAAASTKHAAKLIRDDEIVRSRPPARWAYARR